MHKKINRKAFTMTEVIVVILIISVLWVTVFLGGAAIIKRARTTKVKNDLRNYAIYIENMLYENPKIQYDKLTYSNENTTTGKASGEIMATTDDQNGSLNVLKKLNTEYLTRDIILSDGENVGFKDQWKVPYLYSYAIGNTDTKSEKPAACIVINSSGTNGTDESSNMANALIEKSYISAEDAADNVSAGDDYGLIVWAANGQVSIDYYGFEKKHDGNISDEDESDTEIKDKFDEIDNDEDLSEKANKENVALEPLKIATKLCAMANVINPSTEQLDSAPKTIDGTFSNKVMKLMDGEDTDKYSWAIIYDDKNDYTNYVIMYEGNVAECLAGVKYKVTVFEFKTEGESTECSDSYDALCNIRVAMSWKDVFENGYNVFNVKTLSRIIPSEFNELTIRFDTNVESMIKTSNCIATVLRLVQEEVSTKMSATQIDSASNNGYWYARIIKKLNDLNVTLPNTNTWCITVNKGAYTGLYYADSLITEDGRYTIYKYDTNNDAIITGTAKVTSGKINISTFE